MGDPDSWLGVAMLLGLAIFGVASWLFHRRLRNRHSLRFILSVVALVAWLPVSSVIQFVVLTYFNMDNPGQLANWLLISSEVLVPCLLVLLVPLMFLFGPARVL